MTLTARSALVRLLPSKARLKPLEGLVERQRMVKEPGEVALIRAGSYDVVRVGRPLRPELRGVGRQERLRRLRLQGRLHRPHQGQVHDRHDDRHPQDRRHPLNLWGQTPKVE